MIQTGPKIITILCLVTLIPFLVYLYRQNLDFSSNFTDQLFRANTPVIHFINTNQNNSDLNLRTLCAVESASKHNPEFSIIFHTLSPFPSESMNLNLSNFQIRQTTAEDVLHGTPLSSWYRKGEHKNGPYEHSHLSDAMRLALLWKQGGIYMDTDVWSVKSVSNLSNSIARQDNNFVAGGVMIFDDHHPFLYECMIEFAKKYAKYQYTAQGPDLLTRVLVKKCGIKGGIVDVNSKQVFACLNIHILPPKTFYPVPYTHWKFFFTPISRLYTWRNAYAFHLWNKLSGNFVTKTGNGSFLEEVAKRNCPSSYNLMMQKGEI